MAAEAPYVFRFVGDALAGMTGAYAEAAASQLAQAITPTAVAGVTLFIAAYGGLTIAGKIQQPFSDFVVKAFKVILVASFALNVDNYIQYVVGAINGVESGLVTAMRAPGVPIAPGSIYEQLDQSIGKANLLITATMDKASEHNALTETGTVAGYLMSAFIMSTAVVTFFGVGGALIIATKYMLTIMLGLGPLFIMSLMWPPTANFFDRWLGQTLTFVFTAVLASVVLSMGLAIFSRMVGSITVGESAALFVAMQLLLTGLILAYVLVQVPSLAAGISGGVSMTSLTLRQIAGVATSPASSARAAGRMVNPISNRLDPTTGHQTASSRLEHVAMGRSVWVPQPAYRKAVMERYASGWRADRPNGSKE